MVILLVVCFSYDTKSLDIVYNSECNISQLSSWAKLYKLKLEDRLLRLTAGYI